ncbi:hypothetical protein HRR84_002233 [Exophiala dermatitidis]|nr:hypothetical protein HRR79_009476 [Exophiala dermatitidis]KAJ4602476.1 hypothetical protein HRR84_002233 [Exophiala dermatitidis]KAJ4631179.1 hypothetical protein HRR89_008651 [Exophiala dermatitidis]KAJ4678168.1 hypothetical protein HRR92_003596 [Exophiala dermatitidis]KAJ9000387.1 hypothetical protein HRR94_004965 [Exophiala dermatitidis]
MEWDWIGLDRMSLFGVPEDLCIVLTGNAAHSGKPWHFWKQWPGHPGPGCIYDLVPSSRKLQMEATNEFDLREVNSRPGFLSLVLQAEYNTAVGSGRRFPAKGGPQIERIYHVIMTLLQPGPV